MKCKICGTEFLHKKDYFNHKQKKECEKYFPKINDKFIIKFFTIPKKGKIEINSTRTTAKFINQFPTIKKYLRNRFPEDEWLSYVFSIKRIFKKIYKLPVCQNCGKKIKTTNNKMVACSVKCNNKIKGKIQHKLYIKRHPIAYIKRIIRLIIKSIRMSIYKSFGWKTSFSNPLFQWYLRNIVIKRKYNVTCVSCLPEVRQRLSESLKRVHKERGKEIREKIENTCLKRYGARNYNQSKYSEHKGLLRGIKKYKVSKHFLPNIKRDEYFDSSWEVAFFLYHKYKKHNIKNHPKKIKYINNNKIHYYIVDFILDNRLIEIKGSQFFNKNGKLINPYSKNKEEDKIKQKVFKYNKVKVISSPEINKYLDFCKGIFGGTKWKEQFKLKYD